MVFSKGWKVAQDPTAKTATATGELDVKRNPIDAQSEIAEFDSWWKWRRRRSASIGWGNLMLMTLIFLLSSLWSALLIFLNLEPNQSANYILQTASLDHGHFWQSRLAPSSVQAASASLLLVVIGVYCHLLYLLHVRRPPRRVLSDELKSKGPKTILRKMTTKVDKLTASERMQRLPRVIVRKVLRTIAKFYRDVVSTEGKYRKVWNVLMEIPEIILQILSLQEYMMQGLDSSLLYFYAALMATNAFLAFYHIQFKWNEDTLHHILKDSIVDAIFAVFFPALILFYSFSVFQGDLKAVKIRQKFFPPRIFERKARNFVSAKEFNTFSTDFESLLIHSAWDIVLKLGFTLLACFRWSRITRLLLQRESQGHSLSSNIANNSQPGQQVATKSSKSVAPLDAASLNGSSAQARNLFLLPQSRTIVGVFFLIYGIGCVAYTALAVQVSRSACSIYPQCVQFANMWRPDSSRRTCHCLAYVDRDLAPARSAELVDVTQTLAQLASAGKLRTVQLVNRLINGSLPVEMSSCTGLRNLVLIHTGVEVFPSWVSTTFSNMDYLHIEGDTSSTNLVELPNDFFNSMSKIHTIHLSYLSNLSSLPPLVGLTALESVYFGYLDSIKELPSMEGLSSIQVIAMESLPQVRSLPEIASYQDTLEMVFIQDMPACCSGFLSDGTCNTTFLNCCQEESLQDQSSSSSFNTDSSSSPTCLRLPGDSNLLPTNASLAILNQFAANVSNFCDSAQASCPYILASHLLKSMDICDGVLYRECTSEANGVGICFNQDMGPVQCVHSQSTVDMREAEIAAGCECDVVEEQWLGCT